MPGISSTLAFGGGVTVFDASRPFRIWIRGADVTHYVKAPSIEISASNGSRSTARLVLQPYYDGNDQYAFVPEIRDEVIIHHLDVGRLFAGEVETTNRTDIPGPRGHYTISVQCTDYGVICDRRLVAFVYNLFTGGNASIICYDIVNRFLDGTGITLGTSVAQYMPEEIVFNYVTATEAFNRIASASNSDWRIDYYKAFHMFPKDTGYGPAPFEITDATADDGYWTSLQTSSSKSDFWNRVVVRNSQDLGSLQVDTYTGTSMLVVPTLYALPDKPSIKLNGVAVDEDTVVEFASIPDTPGWQWYYRKGEVGIFSRINVTGTVTVSYESKLSYVVTAQDDDSIADVGKAEMLQEVRDMTDPAAMHALADSLLESGLAAEDAAEVTVETLHPGLLPGQLLTIDTSRPPLSGTFLIESTSAREIAPGILKWSAKGSNAPSRRGSGTTMFQKLIEAKRQPRDRVDTSIGFVLAETIEGIDNPGITQGAKHAFRTARKDGIARKIRMAFKDMGSNAAEVDVLQNGTSIFSTTRKLRLLPGEAEVTRMTFASDPLRITAGDVFTVEIISADDPDVKNGWVELQVMG